MARERKSGAVDEARTRDLNLGKVALYQLSYYRVKQMWCGRRDLNSYVVRHQILSLARLPIPPYPRVRLVFPFCGYLSILMMVLIGSGALAKRGNLR